MRKVLIVLTVILIGLIGAFLGYRYVGPPGPGEVERIIQSPCVIDLLPRGSTRP